MEKGGILPSLFAIHRISLGECLIYETDCTNYYRLARQASLAPLSSHQPRDRLQVVKEICIRIESVSLSADSPDRFCGNAQK